MVKQSSVFQTQVMLVWEYHNYDQRIYILPRVNVTIFVEDRKKKP